MEKSLSNLRVLYVEDEEMVREGVVDYLKFLVKEIQPAANGREGLSLFTTWKPDLVITDIHMPVMDGLTMVEEIRKIDDHVQVVVITAYNDKDYFTRAAELRVFKFLTKPVVMKKLVGYIQECLVFMN